MSESSEFRRKNRANRASRSLHFATYFQQIAAFIEKQKKKKLVDFNQSTLRNVSESNKFKFENSLEP